MRARSDAPEGLLDPLGVVAAAFRAGRAEMTGSGSAAGAVKPAKTSGPARLQSITMVFNAGGVVSRLPLSADTDAVPVATCTIRWPMRPAISFSTIWSSLQSPPEQRMLRANDVNVAKGFVPLRTPQKRAVETAVESRGVSVREFSTSYDRNIHQSGSDRKSLSCLCEPCDWKGLRKLPEMPRECGL